MVLWLWVAGCQQSLLLQNKRNKDRGRARGSGREGSGRNGLEPFVKANPMVSTLYCSHPAEGEEIPDTFLPVGVAVPVVLLLDTLCFFPFFFLASRPTGSEFVGWDNDSMPSISAQA